MKKQSILIPLSFSRKRESTGPSFWIPVFTGMTLFLLAGLVGSAFAGTYSGGTGEPNDPYLIATAEDMNSIGADPNDWDKHFKLVADINLADYTGTQFNIIGYYESYNSPNNEPFTGVFDGNDHTISNFTYECTNTDNIGIFGYVDDPNAEIRDLTLIDPDVNAAGDSDYVGSLVGRLWYGTISVCSVEGSSVSASGSYTGGLVGYNYRGTISDSYARGSVSGSTYTGGLVGENNCGTITNCYSTGSVTGDGAIGGLVGYNGGQISNCSATGSVIVIGNSTIGGLVGYNNGTISNCNATDVNISGGADGAGGLVGWNDCGTISNCYSTGDVNILGFHFPTGGLVASHTSDFFTGTISNCYSTCEVSGYAWTGGLVGYAWEIDFTTTREITNCYATGRVSGNISIGGLVGHNESNIYNCYAKGSISGGVSVGGLVGENGFLNDIPGCVYNCYSTGEVTGSSDVGGLVGLHICGGVDASFWDVNTSGQTDSDGGTTKTTAEMMAMSTFTDAGWDFVGENANGTLDYWRMCVDDVNYPLLSWQFVPDFVCPDGVSFIDYSFFANYWMDTNCSDSSDCDGVDLDFSGEVGLSDLKMFFDHWLEGTQ